MGANPPYRVAPRANQVKPTLRLFTFKPEQQGGVIRRKARDIERFAGMELFMREVERRGYQVAENSGQIVIFCNRAPVRWLTPTVPPISSKEIGAKSFQDFGRPESAGLRTADAPGHRPPR